MSALTQQTPEWHLMRKSKIGASDAPVIMLSSPWKTPYQLLWEKTTESYSESTEAMKRGIQLEEPARQCFILKTGIEVTPDVRFHKEYSWMMASLDGISSDGKVIVEIKCPGKVDHSSAVRGQIPKKYIAQLQHQMCVCDVQSAYYFSFDGSDGVVLQLDRDEKYLEMMIDYEKEFWHCLQKFKSGEYTDKDLMTRKHPIWECVEDLETKEEQLLSLFIPR